MKKIIVATALLSACPLGFAAALMGSPVAANNNAAYIGVGLGVGGMNTPSMNSGDKNLVPGGYSEDLRGFSARPYVGYLWASNNFRYGLELGYIYYPNNKYRYGASGNDMGLKYSGYSVDLLGVGKYFFGDSGFNILGKAGFAYVSQKTKFTETYEGHAFEPYSKTKTKWNPELAVGLGYDFTQNFGMDITYAHIFGDNPKNLSKATKMSQVNSVADINTLLLNFTYHFA